MKLDKGLIDESTVSLILTLLEETDRYGNEIMKELKLRSDKDFQFKEGMLYPVLHKLENKGYVKSYISKGDKDKRRRYYHISKKGKKKNFEEEKKWKVLSTSDIKVLDGKLHFSHQKDKFLEEVLSYVKFSYDREDIKFELESHILDKINHYSKQGYDVATTEQLLINDMGDAKEIGIKLNKQHNPILGWLWRITNVMITLFLVFNIFAIGTFFVTSLFSSNPINYIEKSNIIYKIDIDEKVKLDDTVIHFTSVIYEQNGDMNIFYEYYDTKLWGTGWSLGAIGDITDNLGNTYFSGSGSKSAGIKSKCRRTVKNFSEEADTLIISYDYYNRKYRVEITLQVGEYNE